MATERLAAIYARVSTEEQSRGHVASTETQTAKCREKATLLGLPVASDASGLIVQEEHSGTDLRWEGTKFMALVRRAQRHEFTDLICLDIDRFCRGGPEAHFEQMGYFNKAGVTIHWVLFDVPADMPFSKTITTARAEAAQWWRDKIVEATVRNRTEWAKQGNITRSDIPPFGFQFVYDETRHTRRNHPLVIGYVPDPVTGPALLYMTQHVANGGAVSALPAWLEANNIPTPRGAQTWLRETIRRILHNHTNYGGRRSFLTHSAPLPDAANRPKDRKTKNVHRAVPEAEQYIVDPTRITPPEGLTRDLFERALARLAENRAQSARHAVLSPEQRAEHALLFGGLVRCASCGCGLRVKHNNIGGWLYRCSHSDTVHLGEPTITMSAPLLDGIVWDVAVGAMRDPAFLERLVADTDAAAGPALRAAALRALLTEAEGDGAKTLKLIKRLDPDDMDDAAVIAVYEDDLRKNKATCAELTKSLAAAEAAVATEDARRTTLAAFHAYAVSQGNDLIDKTPVERWHILRALRTRCRVNSEGTGDRLRVAFDIRGLPGAVGALKPSATEDASCFVDFTQNSVGTYLVEWLQTAGATAFAALPVSTAPEWWEVGHYASEEDALAQLRADACEADDAGGTMPVDGQEQDQPSNVLVPLARS